MHEKDFWSSIAEGDDLARLALADWLEERKDPRAPWVRDADICRHMLPDGRDPLSGLMAGLPEEDDDDDTYWSPGGEEIAQILARLGPAALPAARRLTRLTIITLNENVDYDESGLIITPLGSAVADSSLVAIGPDCVADVLSEVAVTNRHRYTRACQALRRMAGDAAPRLREALQHDSPRVRGVAALALIEVDPDAAMPVLVEMLREEHERGHGDDTSAYVDAIARASLHVTPPVEQLQALWPELDEDDRQRLAESHPDIGTGDLSEARRLLAPAPPSVAARKKARSLIEPHLDNDRWSMRDAARRLMQRLEALESG
jgi:uncharacterized protein (TIGR02996 family)